MLRPIYPGSIHTPLEEALIYLGLTRQFKYANMWNTKYAYQICLEMCLWMQDKPLLHWQYFSLPFFRCLDQLRWNIGFNFKPALMCEALDFRHRYDSFTATLEGGQVQRLRVVSQRGNRKRSRVSSLKIQVRRPHSKCALNYTTRYLVYKSFFKISSTWNP